MAPASIRNGEAGVWRARRHRASAVRDTAFERHLTHFARCLPTMKRPACEALYRWTAKRRRKMRSSKSCLRGMEVAGYTAWAC